MFFRLICLLVFCLFPVVSRAQNYYMIDLRAKRATWKEAQTPETLVSYLTKNLSSDAEKARAIAAWIVFQVDRDGYRAKQLISSSNKGTLASEPVENDVFKTRIGTPQEFAALFHQLASLAGLEVVTIPGYAGYHISAPRNMRQPIYTAAATILGYEPRVNADLQRYMASWNAVKIKGEWQLIDTYWMISGDEARTARDIQTDQGMALFLKRRLQMPPQISSLIRGKKIDDKYFLAKPRFFIKTHFPNDSVWQFITPPRTWATFVS